MSDKLKYSVLVLKRDQEHISVVETDSFDEADKLWQSLKDKWTTCLHEQKPFELRKPIITAFDPGLIYEITVRPVSDVVKNPDNPYQQSMQRNGFSATFRGGSELLDNGYSR